MTVPPPPNRLLRGTFLALGLLCVGVALAGIVLPLIPVTFPTLLAAYFFARSSPHFDRWLSQHRVLGPIVRDWRAGAGFTVRAKAIAVAAIVASFVFSGMVAVRSPTGRWVLTLTAAALCAYVVSRPTKPAGRVSGIPPSGSAPR